ncbi:MAG TPA: hypothetical protein PK364_04230 [Synergistaceae bacterium]|nr:hypothetical protein [Synergistaceae bacterium]HPQ37387.1 hypothetical protein [Synergistaceae bacterium]
MKKMKKSVVCLIGGALLLCFALGAYAQEEPSTFQILGKVEQITYGEEHTGGLLQRLEAVERDLFGRELPGSIAERQSALINFMEKGTQGRPSFLFKLGILEWAVEQKTFPHRAANKRITSLEELVEGSSNPDGPLAMRLERVASILLGNDIIWEEVSIPQGTVFKVELMETLSPSSAEPGDTVQVALNEDFVLGDHLLAPRGSLVDTTILEVKPPRSFGRPSEINLSFKALYPLGPENVLIGVGENAQEAAKADPAAVAAAGASFAGLVAFGPLGLAGGFFVRGDGKEVPAGSLFFLETLEEQSVHAYPVPEELRGLFHKGGEDAGMSGGSEKGLSKDLKEEGASE